MASHQGNIATPVYRWYDANTPDANLLFEGNPLIINNVQSDTSFYLSVSNNSYCETLAEDRSLVSVTVNPNASMSDIVINDTSICYNSSTMLKVKTNYMGLLNPVYRWYSSQDASVPFYEGDTYTTANLTAGVTYYLTVSGTGVCENTVRKPVVVSMINYISDYKDIRLQLCQYPARSISLNSYIDTLLFESISWTGHNTPIGSSDGRINTGNLQEGIYVYTYNIENTCTSGQAKVYVKVGSNYIKQADTVAFCCEEFMTGYINLKQIFGAEANGTITAVTPGIDAYLSEAPAGSPFAGSYYFDGIAAWGDPSFPTMNYRGDSESKLFEFQYTPIGANCISDSPIKVTIIITGALLP
jgi:hypothetical protein